MLHTLAATLLASPASMASAPNQADVLLGLVPADSVAVVRTTDFAAWISKPEDEYGAWERFFTDPRLLAMFDNGDEFAEFGPEEIEASTRFLATIEGAAVGLRDLNGDDPSAVGALLLTEDFREVWEEALATIEATLEETEIGGQPALSVVREGEPFLMLAEVGDAAVFAIGEEADSIAGLLEDQLAALEDGATHDAWWLDHGQRIDDPLIEGFIDFAGLEFDDPESEAVGDWVEGVYIGAALGEGNFGEITFGVSLIEHSATEALSAAFGEADVSTLSAISDDATVATAIHCDLLALTYAAIEIAEEYAPEESIEAGFDQAMTLASEALGIDVEDELLGNLSGDWVVAQWIDGPSLLAAESMDEDADELPDGFMNVFPVIGARLSDPEPYYELIETAVGLVGGIAEIEESDLGSTLVVDAGDGVSFRIMVTDDWLVMGLDEGRVDGFARGAGGAFDDDDLERLSDATSGSAVSITTMESVFGLLEALMDAGAQGEDIPEEAFEVLEIASEHLGGACATDIEFTSTGVLFRTLTF